MAVLHESFYTLEKFAFIPMNNNSQSLTGVAKARVRGSEGKE